MMLDEAFGQDRGFHQRYGYHADIVRPKVTETFPDGWQERMLTLEDLERVYFLEHQLLDAQVLRARIAEIPLPADKVAGARVFLDDLLKGI